MTMTNEQLRALYKPTGNSRLTAARRKAAIFALLQRDGHVTAKEAVQIVGNTQIRNDLLYLAYRGEIRAWPPLPPANKPDRLARTFGLITCPLAKREAPMTGLTDAANEAVTMAANEAVAEARKHLPFLPLTHEEIGTLVDKVYFLLADKVAQQIITISDEELDDVLQAASDAFWAVIIKRFPAGSGDLGFERTLAFESSARAAVKEWLDNNVPTVRHE